MPTFRHILAATDFSETSARAVELARAMAAESGARLTVVHVCEVPADLQGGAIPYDLLVPAARAAQARVDEVVESLRGACPGAQALVKMGVAWEQILAVAAEARADLIVLGTHGRRGFAHAMMGSVAERVVRLSPVPVLTVRAGA